MSEAKWNKKIFALLLAEAKGVRSWRQFASECDISYVQMRKLSLCEQENPPRPKLIRKVAAKAFGEIDLEDLMFAAGINISDSSPLPPESGRSGKTAIEKYRLLSAKDRKTVDKMVDFLLFEQSKEKGD